MQLFPDFCDIEISNLVLIRNVFRTCSDNFQGQNKVCRLGTTQQQNAMESKYEIKKKNIFVHYFKSVNLNTNNELHNTTYINRIKQNCDVTAHYHHCL